MSTTNKGMPRHGRRRSAPMRAVQPSKVADEIDEMEEVEDKVIVDLGEEPVPAPQRAAPARTVTPAPVAAAPFTPRVAAPAPVAATPFTPRVAAPARLLTPEPFDVPDLDAEHLEFDDDERSQRYTGPRPVVSGKDALIGMLVHDAPAPDDGIVPARAAPGEVPLLHSNAGLYTMWFVIIGLLVAGGAFGVYAVFFYKPL